MNSQALGEAALGLKDWFRQVEHPLEAGMVAAVIAFPATLALHTRAKTIFDSTAPDVVHVKPLIALVAFFAFYFFVLLIEVVGISFAYVGARSRGFLPGVIMFLPCSGVWFLALLLSASSSGANFQFWLVFSVAWTAVGLWAFSSWSSWYDGGDLLVLNAVLLISVFMAIFLMEFLAVDQGGVVTILAVGAQCICDISTW